MRKFLTLLLSAAAALPAQAAIISKTDTSFTAIDNGGAFRSFTFEASDFAGPSAVTGVTLSVLFDKCDGAATTGGCTSDGLNGRQPYFNEIGFALVAPDGTSVSLVENQYGTEVYERGHSASFGYGAAPLTNISIVFDDDGAALGSTPTSGTFAPVGSLSDFIGLSGLGTWRFFFEDDSHLDALAIRNVTLSLESADAPTDVPAPGALALLGMGSLAIAARRRRRG